MNLNRISQKFQVDMYVKVVQQNENIFDIARDDLVNVIWNSTIGNVWDEIIEEFRK